MRSATRILGFAAAVLLSTVCLGGAAQAAPRIATAAAAPGNTGWDVVPQSVTQA